MAATARVRVRMEPELKVEAAQVLDAIGLTPSEAVRILFTRIVAEKRFPMALHVPNETTLAAMREAREGRLQSAASFDEMLAQLNTDE